MLPFKRHLNVPLKRFKDHFPGEPGLASIPLDNKGC